jgi:hypothetical protein
MSFYRFVGRVFPFVQRQQDLFIYSDASSSARAVLKALATPANAEQRRNCSFVADGQGELFVKSVFLKSLASRLRVTFGWRRRGGHYDWPVAELLNNLSASSQDSPTPKLRGFGIRRNSFGLVHEFYLITEALAGYQDARHALAQGQVEVATVVESIFNLMAELHSKNVHHLDLWCANIMLDPQGQAQIKAIDLENCYIGATDHLTQVLAFQFGFLYFEGLKHYLSEAEYDDLVEQALEYFTHVDRAVFAPIYATCKRRHISRKGRIKLLKYGQLP